MTPMPLKTICTDYRVFGEYWDAAGLVTEAEFRARGAAHWACEIARGLPHELTDDDLAYLTAVRLGSRTSQRKRVSSAANGRTGGRVPAAAPHYITRGDVRGDCGHRHRTLEGARACVARDVAGCQRQGGYSDRAVYQVTGPRVEHVPQED